MKPYYEDSKAGITIYNADCREVLPQLPPIDLILTDPPYGVGRRYGSLYNDKKDGYWEWFVPVVHQMRKTSSVVAIHHLLYALKYFIDWDWIIAWHKPYAAGARIGNSPLLPHWEPILLWGIHSLGTKREVLPDWLSFNPEKSPRPQIGISPRTADDLDSSDHPLPKPLALEKKLVSALSSKGAIILDPFMGGGTTLRAAKDLGRKAIGIEIEERYCEIAVQRLSQEVMPLFDPPQPEATQEELM